MRGHDGAPPVRVADKMMAAFDAQYTETGLPERGNQFGARYTRASAMPRWSPLDADELQFLLRRAFDVQAQRKGLADALGDLIERARLRVAASDLRNRGYGLHSHP